MAQIDGRGSSGDGDRKRFEVWQKLGSVEVADQIEVTQYLIKNLHIIDPRRIAVWGWSYGGYATLAILSDENQEIFQCGISVAPVTNWRYYGKRILKQFNMDIHPLVYLGLLVFCRMLRVDPTVLWYEMGLIFE